MRKVFSILTVLVLSVSCITTLDTKIDDNISVDELFFKAQVLQNRTATKSDNLAVIGLYSEVLNRFPDLTAICIEAKYEIGIIYYKMKDYKISKNYFYEILKTHELDTTGTLPEWTKLLANELISKIEEKTKKDTIKEVSVVS